MSPTRSPFPLGVVGPLLALAAGCHAVADSDTDVVDSDDTDVIDTNVVRSGLDGRLGTGTMDGAGYVGTEERYFIGDDGDGADVCRLGYTLTSTASRTDCATAKRRCKPPRSRLCAS